MSIPRVYSPVAPSANGAITLVGDEAHRLRHVLRVATGEAVAVFDGRGCEWVGRVSEVTRQSVRLSGLEVVTPVAEARVPVTLVVGVLKGDQMDAVVRDATMLGVVAIQPVRTSHVTVPSAAWKSGAARERWQRVAVASAAQCRRAVVPAVLAVSDFVTCLREPAGLRLMCVEPEFKTGSEDWKVVSLPESVQVFIGPEGGWSPQEVEQAVAAGARLMSLGPRTLRAETSPLVALTLVSAQWGW